MWYFWKMSAWIANIAFGYWTCSFRDAGMSAKSLNSFG